MSDEKPEITDEQIRDKAREIVLEDIADQMHDRMGLGEQLYDLTEEYDADELEPVIVRLENALHDIRDDLARQWGRLTEVTE